MDPKLSAVPRSQATLAFGSESVAQVAPFERQVVAELPLESALRSALTDTVQGRRYLLVLRFAAFNLACFALLGAAYLHDWLAIIVRADGTYLSVGIFIVFLGGLAMCAKQIWDVSCEMNWVHASQPPPRSTTQVYLAGVADRDAGSRAIAASALRTQLASRISITRYIANSLVLLGLIGTVLGFVIALSAVDPDAARDLSSVSPMVGQLLQGMYVALYTTLVGSVLHLWLSANYHMLAVGASNFATRLIARGEGIVRV